MLFETFIFLSCVELKFTVWPGNVGDYRGSSFVKFVLVYECSWNIDRFIFGEEF